ncbi:MAG: S8 family serine peptidase [Chloroflexota bacterium]|nr:S8 family serine peptidase [Chloroflexota bacterium]
MRLSLLFRSLVVFAVVLTLFAGARPGAAGSGGGRYVPGEVLIQFHEGATAAERADARARVGATVREQIRGAAQGRGRLELVSLRSGGTVESAVRALESHPAVKYAEPNWIYTHNATSNDPYYTNGSLWGMYGDKTSPANQYGSQAGEAWATGHTGSDTVHIGVIDEGIDFRHEDLAANIWTNPVDVADGVDNDGNGYVDDIHGWDFVNNDNTIYDGKGPRDTSTDAHGTHVSGTIGGVGGNGKGVVGVNWNVTIISAKFLGKNGGTTANAIKAVDYITDLKIRHKLNLPATNNSWGGGGYSQALYDAIERANTANVLFIAAAGNGGNDGVGDDNDATPHYPSSYTNENIIAVAAIAKDGSITSWSNYGATSVDLGAPGSGIYSTTPKNTYKSYSGTSMATPHVTGAAALYASTHSGVSAAQIKNAILTSTIPTASLSGKTVTGGRLDANAALSK